MNMQNALASKVYEFDLEPIECYSSGPINARIAVVTTAPSYQDLQSKNLFSGVSGKFVRDKLAKCGVNRSNAYFTSLFKHDTGRFKQEDKSTASNNTYGGWVELLRWELAQLPDLECLVIFGNEAMQALINESGIYNWRGSFVDVVVGERTVPAIITFNPAEVMRNVHLERKGIPTAYKHMDYVFDLDLRKVKNMVAGKVRKYEITEIINPSASEVIEYCAHLNETDKPISTDIETVGGSNGETVCIGLTNNRNSAMCVPFFCLDNIHYFTPEEEVRVWNTLQQLLGNPKSKLVMQNGVFDTLWLWFKNRLKIAPMYMDTLLAHHTLNSTLKHSLAFLVSKYTYHPYYKDDKSGWNKNMDINRFWRYNCKDAALTLAIAETQIAELAHEKMDEFFFNHVMKAQPHLIQMCLHGVPMDVELKEQLTIKYLANLQRDKLDFHAKCAEAAHNPSYAPNPSSPKQMKELYFEILNLRGRGDKTDAENRTRMLKHPMTPEPAKEILNLHNKIAKDQKFVGTYLQSVIDEDGCCRTEYKQSGTQSAPGRLSSGQTPWGNGMNLQNQPYDSYGMFHAPEGFIFWYYDLSQAEARYVGWEARIDAWIEDFEKARLSPGAYDCHRSLAATMWDMAYDDVPSSDKNEDGTPSLRYIAKRCRHGLNYRMAADRLATVTGLSSGVASEAYEIYHATTPELRHWWRHTIDEVNRTGVLFNKLGRRLKFPTPPTEAQMDSVVAFKPQSFIGDWNVRVTYQVAEDDDWPVDSRTLINAHDALIGITRPDKLGTTMKVLKKYVEAPTPFQGLPPLILPGEFKYTAEPTNWRLSDEGALEYFTDTEGYYRWNGLTDFNF